MLKSAAINRTRDYVLNGLSNIVVLCDEFQSRKMLNLALYVNIIQPTDLVYLILILCYPRNNNH